MILAAFKALSAAVLFVVSLAGGFLPLMMSRADSRVPMLIAYAFSGGILASVALVHMLPDAAEDLTDAGKGFNRALGGGDDDAFPLGNALFLAGFFLISFVEVILHHALGSHGSFHGGDEALLEQADGANAAGWAALVGLSIHSVVEGVAAGAGGDQAQVGFVILAIACHKGFAAFALASANLPLMRPGKRAVWISLVLWFALSGSAGILAGMAASRSLDGPWTAAITSLAAGSLLSVGVTEMLLPACKDRKCIGWKLFASAASMLGMSLLAVWA